MSNIKMNIKTWNSYNEKAINEALSILKKAGYWGNSDKIVHIDGDLNANQNIGIEVMNYDSDETDEEKREREERKRKRYNECRNKCDDKYASAKYACDTNSSNPVSKAACLAIANAKWADCVAYCEIAVGRP